MIHSDDNIEQLLKKISRNVLNEPLPKSSLQYLTDIIQSHNLGLLEKKCEGVLSNISKTNLTLEEHSSMADYSLVSAAINNDESLLNKVREHYESCVDNSGKEESGRYFYRIKKRSNHFMVLRDYFMDSFHKPHQRQKLRSEIEVKQNAFRSHLSDLKRAFLETDHFQIEKSSQNVALIMRTFGFDSAKMTQKFLYARQDLRRKLSELKTRHDYTSGIGGELLQKEISFYQETCDYGSRIARNLIEQMARK